MLTIQQPGTSSGKGEVTGWIFSQEQIPTSWEELESFVASSVAHSRGTLTVELIKIMLERGEATAFATARNGKLECVLVVHLTEYIGFKAARIVVCAGKGLKDAAKYLDALESWALTQGACELEAFCRPAVSRLLRSYGFKLKFEQVHKDLRRKLQ